MQATQPHVSTQSTQHNSHFRLEHAVRLLPKFNGNEIEDYLVAFERTAELNKWPQDQLCCVLQSQMTGKGLKIFSELTLEQAQNYQCVKKAILDCYQLTPQAYRSKFRQLEKSSSETYSDFAFTLKNSFKRWLEGEHVYDNLEGIRQTFLLEQFSEKIPSDIKLWLIDQKPTTLTKAAQLADHFVAVRRPTNIFTHESGKSVNFNFRQSQDSRKSKMSEQNNVKTRPTNSSKATQLLNRINS